MKDLLFDLLQAVIIAAVPIITKYLCDLLKAKKEEATAKVTDGTAKRLLNEAGDAVITAVTVTNQTYVDTLKKSGTFTPENQREAFQKSYDTAMKIMTQEAKDFISSAYGSLTEWLTLKIEEQVKVQKNDTILTGELISE
jgi:hypothetical protein